MREKELRLALVCFGGVSLAVYMHGVAKEILKLVRASAALHRIDDPAARVGMVFAPPADADPAEYDTEPFYFELLQAIGPELDLRVVVDVIAGSSAGGINGIMLARALAHDLPVGPHRDLWLEEADVGRLVAPGNRAGRWSKWFLRPGLWLIGRLKLGDDAELRAKLSLFVRSRWFQPPFDPEHMAGLMLDGLAAMGEPRTPDASLMPAGHPLDLFVTLTDFFGYPRDIAIHDPPVVREREHRIVLNFRYRRWSDGEVESELAAPDVPALAFAARATASFPSAFPAARIADMDAALASRGRPWPDRAAVLQRLFPRYRAAGIDPETANFVDGSVLANKPFAEAIEALKQRAAFREVDRRLVYIDPDPAAVLETGRRKAPGFFSMLKGTIYDIQVAQPIANDLAWIGAQNEIVRRTKGLVEAARPRVAQQVRAITGRALDKPVDRRTLARWRDAANSAAAAEAGFAYEGYIRLKLDATRVAYAKLLSRAAGLDGPVAEERVERAIAAWADARGLGYRASVQSAGSAWVDLLLDLDVAFRRRRLRFVIRTINGLYGSVPQTAPLDRLKRQLYGALDWLRRAEAPRHWPAALVERTRNLFAGIPADPAAFVAANGPALDALHRDLAQALGMRASTEATDAIFTALDPAEWPAKARREVLTAYVGFAFWDVLTLSLTNWRDLDEFDEIRIDRISPEDARAFGPEARLALKGTRFGHFGAFFSRAYRENDYLWGRLHAVERLIALVCDAAGEAAPKDIDGLRRRAFRAVLDAEEPVLTESGDLVARLRALLDERAA